MKSEISPDRFDAVGAADKLRPSKGTAFLNVAASQQKEPRLIWHIPK
jgi:hypothetical protein